MESRLKRSMAWQIAPDVMAAISVGTSFPRPAWPGRYESRIEPKPSSPAIKSVAMIATMDQMEEIE